ncbi:putative AAA+ superfamily ATPase [Algoriphagus sp. 4150]|uniref:ATP-binding protein n=1 Tax=Algoriphagus sp. 4150 TaxID=2817756 RepID=UPI002863E56A|nr:AAA family ATPase [Algoriphagus sp. 4150]MDR7130426.1 putative AAA+ superfamily ATPase [Algoriphagus sp. 4150]
MEALLLKSNLLIRDQKLDFRRFLFDKIDWNDRLIGVLGARGTGKTTLLLQLAVQEFTPQNTGRVLYTSLDDIYFSANTLVGLAEQFEKLGGEILILDEVHKYPNWAREIKNIYDFQRGLKIIFTGSSIIDMIKENADLSRRAIFYNLPGLSFREYLNISGLGNFKAIELESLIKGHESIANKITKDFKPLIHFPNYLKAGYYPFFKENPNTYYIRIEQVLKLILEIDLQFIKGIDSHNLRKLYQLLYILSQSVPFTPNISKLSEKIGITRNTLLLYLSYLEKAKIINSLQANGKSTSILQKPDKIYLENTNLGYAISKQEINTGNERETFFLNQLKNAGHEVHLPKYGDFSVNETYVFEIGGYNKSATQLQNQANSYVVSDGLEVGFKSKIPLWLFGFLY